MHPHKWAFVTEVQQRLKTLSKVETNKNPSFTIVSRPKLITNHGKMMSVNKLLSPNLDEGIDLELYM